MNLNIFHDTSYFNKLEELITIDKVDPLYPFKEMLIDSDNLITDDGYDLTGIYKFLKKIHIFYYYNQSHYGYVQINGRYYIVEIGDVARESLNF